MTKKTNVNFLVEQLILQSKKVHGERYDANTMVTAICLYLRSRNCYSALREYTTLPHPDTIKNYFGSLDTPGEIFDCENTMKLVFDKLTDKGAILQIISGRESYKTCRAISGKSCYRIFMR